MTLSPSMRSAWRSIQGLPAIARIAIATQAAPASISTRRTPSASGENVTAEPAKASTSAGAMNGVTAVQTSSSASVIAALRPIRAASAGEEKIGGATTLSISASRSAGERSTSPLAARPKPTRTGTASMVQPAAAISSAGRRSWRPSAPGSTRRNARQSSANTVSAKYRANQRAERRQRDPEQDRHRDRNGAAAAEPGERPRRCDLIAVIERFGQQRARSLARADVCEISIRASWQGGRFRYIQGLAAEWTASNRAPKKPRLRTA